MKKTIKYPQRVEISFKQAKELFESTYKGIWNSPEDAINDLLFQKIFVNVMIKKKTWNCNGFYGLTLPVRAVSQRNLNVEIVLKLKVEQITSNEYQNFKDI